MNISLTFKGWYKDGKLIAETPDGTWLNCFAFHSNAVFDGDIYLCEGTELDVKEAMEQGYVPHFEVGKGEKDPSGEWSYAKEVALATEAIDYVECFIEAVDVRIAARITELGHLDKKMAFEAMAAELQAMKDRLELTILGQKEKP